MLTVSFVKRMLRLAGPEFLKRANLDKRVPGKVRVVSIQLKHRRLQLTRTMLVDPRPASQRWPVRYDYFLTDMHVVILFNDETEYVIYYD